MKDDNPVHKKNVNWWSTEDEKNFIDHIGTYTREFQHYLRLDQNEMAVRRVKLLERYLEALIERVKWDRIDQDEIWIHASKALLEAGRAVYGELWERTRDEGG